MDRGGNVYVSDATNATTGRVLELPKSRTGFKSQKQLLFGGLSGGIAGVAVDGPQNAYVADSTNQNVKELPHSGGSQTTLPFGGSPFVPVGLAVDWKGNVYAADDGAGRVLELVKTNTGYQPQTQLPFSGLSTSLTGLAVDKFQNVYVVDNGNGNVQVLFHETGNQMTLPFGSISNPVGIAVDTHLSVYVTAYNSGGNTSVIRIKRTAEALYAAPEQLPIGGLSNAPGGTAVEATEVCTSRTPATTGRYGSRTARGLTPTSVGPGVRHASFIGHALALNRHRPGSARERAGNVDTRRDEVGQERSPAWAEPLGSRISTTW